MKRIIFFLLSLLVIACVLFLLLANPFSQSRPPLKEIAPYQVSLTSGQEIKVRPGQDKLLFPGARSVDLIFYRSQGRVASGSLLLPSSERFQRPPLIIFQHGMTGLANRCAPSRADESIDNLLLFYRDAFTTWLEAGYAIAMPDDPGLGTRGWYRLSSRAQAKSALDMFRALKSRYGFSAYANLGHSQGGQGAIALSGARLKPRANIIYSPAAFFETQLKIGSALLSRPSQGAGLLFFLLRSAILEADLNPRDILADGVFLEDGVMSRDGVSLWQRSEEECLPEIIQAFMEPRALSAKELLRSRDWDKLEPLLKVIRRMEVRNGENLLFLQGGLDDIIFPQLTKALVKDLRARGVAAQYRLYPNATHQDLVFRSRFFVLRYLDNLFAQSEI